MVKNKELPDSAAYQSLVSLSLYAVHPEGTPGSCRGSTPAHYTMGIIETRKMETK